MILEKLSGWVNQGKRMADKKNMANLVSWAMIIVIGWVFVSAARWSFYSADDFSHANGVGVFGGSIWELFRAAIAYMIEIYKTWQGTYFSMFLQGFLSPINGFGEVQLAVVMVGNVVLFILALILLVRSLCTLIDMERYMRTFLSLLGLFSIFAFKAWTEIFYWFSGATSYSFPLSTAMLAIVLYLKNRNMLTYVIACILAFLASGGSLEVAGISCWGILTILLVKGFRNLKIKDCTFFASALLGALINAAAPGNYIRRDGTGNGGLHFFGSLIHSINRCISSLEWLLFQTPFLLIIVLCVFIGFRIGGGKWFHKALLYKLIIMCAFMPTVTFFPACLGYFGTDYFPNRCEFVGTCVLVIAVMLLSVLLGVVLKEKGCCLRCSRVEVMALLFLCLILPMQNEGYRYTNTVIYRMYNNASYNYFKQYHDSVGEIYKQIEESESQDVIIEGMPEAVSDFPEMLLATDAENWINQAIAKYYGKNSVSLKLQE